MGSERSYEFFQFEEITLVSELVGKHSIDILMGNLEELPELFRREVVSLSVAEHTATAIGAFFGESVIVIIRDPDLVGPDTAAGNRKAHVAIDERLVVDAACVVSISVGDHRSAKNALGTPHGGPLSNGSVAIDVADGVGPERREIAHMARASVHWTVPLRGRVEMRATILAPFVIWVAVDREAVKAGVGRGHLLHPSLDQNIRAGSGLVEVEQSVGVCRRVGNVPVHLA